MIHMSLHNKELEIARSSLQCSIDESKIVVTHVVFDPPVGYPMGMGTHRVWVWVKICTRAHGYG
jgi:hypothetical protein